MMRAYVFDWEVTDSKRQPINWGRVVVLASSRSAAFNKAFDMVSGSTRCFDVSELYDCI